jgi:hypothetical protein
MNHLDLTVAVLHAVRGWIARAIPERDGVRDRGAVSLEQVLWFVAAGVSVAVIAGILWSQISEQANSPISTPSAP